MPRERVDLEDFAESETGHLSPMPCWQGLPEAEIPDRLAGLTETNERENAKRRTVEGMSLLGAKTVLRRHPHDRTENFHRSPAPRLHAASKEAWSRLRDAYNAFAPPSENPPRT